MKNATEGCDRAKLSMGDEAHDLPSTNLVMQKVSEKTYRAGLKKLPGWRAADQLAFGGPKSHREYERGTKAMARSYHLKAVK